MLVIRLARVGKKKKAEFRIVVQEKQRDPYGTTVDRVGYYNPQRNPAVLTFDKEKVLSWLSKGAQPTATVHNLFVNAGVLQTPKRKIVRHHKEAVDPKATAKVEAKPAA